jgi:glycosyltransferase involved in cell wall biosynthesis
MMPPPRVSILLPNLNHRPYIEERLATIYAQTFTDWELIVADSHSTDGAWEILKAAAAANPRIHAAQTPQDGPYPNWNRCLERARGDLVYIATSDDTMAPDCLAKLVAALDANPDCDIAQCCLHAIDAQGAIIPGWWRLTGLARFLGDDYLRPHIRRAPYDGVLHAGMHTIYHSITQLLIRKNVFNKTGPFSTNFGAGGDFCWGMKVGFVCNIVHVPDFLATWRIHADQASFAYRESAAERELMTRMVDEALAARPAEYPSSRLPASPLRFPYRYEHHRLAYAEAPTQIGRLAALLHLALTEPGVALRAVNLRIAGERHSFDKTAYIRHLLKRFDLERCFECLPGPTTPPPP